VAQRKSQKFMSESLLGLGHEQFLAARLQQLTILNAGWTHLFTSSTAQTAIDMFAKRLGSVCQSTFSNGAH
jgi:hypothetical protein